MRQHGRAEISPTNPRARGVCDKCGFIYNHHKLKWRTDWRGTKLQNLRVLVCDSCYDQYQQNGQRTILLPPDPVPIMNARPEMYVSDSQPLSAIGANPSPLLWRFSGQIGNMTNAAGVPAAFDGNANKPAFLSAMRVTPDSSFENYVGINWSESPPATPPSLGSPVLSHTISSFVLTAPNDSTFGSTGYAVQGSNLAILGSWTTIASGNIAGTVGEVISGTTTLAGRYQFNRVAFSGYESNFGSFSPSLSSPTISFSNNNLTATGGGVAVDSIALTNIAPQSAGKFYFETTINLDVPNNANIAIGLAPPTWPVSTFMGTTFGSICIPDNNGGGFSGVLLNNVTVANLQIFTQGDVVGVAVDLNAALIWMRVNGGIWNLNALANPTTGVGGISIAGLILPVAPAAEANTAGNTLTINFGAAAYANAAPAGFNNWPGTANPITVAQVSFSVSDGSSI